MHGFGARQRQTAVGQRLTQSSFVSRAEFLDFAVQHAERVYTGALNGVISFVKRFAIDFFQNTKYNMWRVRYYFSAHVGETIVRVFLLRFRHMHFRPAGAVFCPADNHRRPRNNPPCYNEVQTAFTYAFSYGEQRLRDAKVCGSLFWLIPCSLRSSVQECAENHCSQKFHHLSQKNNTHKIINEIIQKVNR